MPVHVFRLVAWLKDIVFHILWRQYMKRSVRQSTMRLVNGGRVLSESHVCFFLQKSFNTFGIFTMQKILFFSIFYSPLLRASEVCFFFHHNNYLCDRTKRKSWTVKIIATMFTDIYIYKSRMKFIIIQGPIRIDKPIAICRPCLAERPLAISVLFCFLLRSTE